MKKFNFQDVFDNGGYDHFTHYDYLMQTMTNGQMGAFKEHLKLIQNASIIALLPLKNKSYEEIVKAEILGRMKK
jgi:hypothetical protein